MPKKFVLTTTATILGRGSSRKADFSVDNALETETSVPRGYAGTLTTRTSASVGTITLSAGHAILTGDVVDLYWTAGGVGQRARVVVGTVAGTSVPITGGGGTDLPAQVSAITVSPTVVETWPMTGNALLGMIADVTGSARGQATFLDAGNAVLASVQINQAGEGAYIWYSTSGATNVLAGAAVASVSVSTADPTTDREVRVGGFRN
jgi:hypothetical protein